MKSMTMDIPMKVAPRGLPTCLRCVAGLSDPAGDEGEDWSEVFRRKSCVTAIPMEAKLKLVLSHARNVRSTPSTISISFGLLHI